MDEDKAKAIELGEAAGEAAAQELYASKGIVGVAATLRPRPFEGYSKAFYELWGGGDEPWLARVQNLGLALKSGAPPYHIKAFDAVFCRGARRWCEMLVRGYLDARAGVPFAVSSDDGSKATLELKLDLLRRRTALGDRSALTEAYETGHKRFTNEMGEEG